MGATTTLYLVRHGEADTGAGSQSRMIGCTDIPLNGRGRAQAMAMQERLREADFHAIYSSPLKRALETARLIAPPAPPVVTHHLLREIDCGAADGLLITEVQSRFPEHWERNQRQQDPQFRWPGGESYLEFRQRCLEAIETIADASRGSNVLIVTHAGVITQILNYLYGDGPALWSAHRVNNGSLTILCWGETTRGVITFNETGKESEANK